MGLIDKEVIRPGEYWYTDADTGQPRKLTVTPELCKYWHDQGNAMLATGLTVPVPAEHDFNAHPMTPAEKLLNNSGWVRGYSLKDGVLHSSVEILNPEVEKKLPHTIRWTSPWINSFTDGNGREWKNVISHLALTARPRIVNQKPFGSVAAALSLAQPIKTWSDVSNSGIHLSRAGLLLDTGLPKYPIAFSVWSGSTPSNDVDAAFAWSEAARKAAAETRRRNAAARKTGQAAPTRKPRAAKPDPHEHSSAAQKLSHTAGGRDFGSGWSGDNASSDSHADKARLHADLAHSSSGRKESWVAHAHHKSAAESHVEAAKEHYMAGRHGEAEKHASAANAHFQAASHHENQLPSRMKSKKKKGKAFAVADLKKKPPPGADVDPDNDGDIDIDGEEDTDDDADDADEFPDDGDPTNNDKVDLPPIGSEEGDVSMVELLCDLLGALGITVEASTDEENFKRQLYNATMTEIHALTGKAKADEEPNRTNPPGQPPNNPKKKPDEQNPLVPQQEQQPMYMSLDEINKIPDATMKTIALSMYNENQKLRTEMSANAATVASLRDAKLKEANDKRATRVALLGKLCPKAKSDLDAMLSLPAMALSLGNGGEVVDPMNQTLAVLEKGLASLPQMLHVEQSALSVAPQPKDADMLDEKRADELADSMARMMGCPPAKQTT